MDIERMYMTVDISFQPDGMELMCWISTQRSWLLEVNQFPHGYTHMSNSCTWLIHSNFELTVRVCAMVTEYADKLCAEAVKKNQNRKLANR